MEVVHRRVEEEEVVVMMEEEEVEQLLPRRRLADPKDDDDIGESSDDTTDGGFEVHPNGISDEKSVYFDDKNGLWKCHDCIWTHKIGQSWIYHLHRKPFNQGDTKLQWSENIENREEISKLVNDVINRQNLETLKGEILTVSTTTDNVIVEESDDEEVIEMEFERAVDKVHTHTPYCPNCSNRITKVILRRKKRASPRPDKPLDLLGCLSCFSIFIPSGDCLNPFGLFKSKPKVESPTVGEEQPSIDRGGTTTNARGSKPALGRPNVGPSTGLGSTTTNAAGTTTNAAAHSVNPFKLTGSNSNPKLKSPKFEDALDGSTTTNAGGVLGDAKPEHNPPHSAVDIFPPHVPELSGGRPVIQEPLLSSNNQRSISLEILKCVVYGGLIESIASLSIVSSAAASDATTLNVVVIGLATLFSGLIAFGCNLVELRNDSSDGKYEEVLGRKGHFVFHSTFAILSYLVFGLVAPTTYGFAFRESDDRDYKILAMAAAAFACIFLLAIGKAYVRGEERLGGYVKTTLYYVTLAISASGVAYAAGDLFGMVLDNLGWFRPGQDVGPRVSAWASY